MKLKHIVLLGGVYLGYSFAFQGPTPLTCMQLSQVGTSSWVEQITLTNGCTQAIDLQQSLVQFHSSQPVQGTYWGAFGTLSYPQSTTITSQQDEDHYTVSLPLIFPAGKWVNTTLPTGQSIQLNFNTTPEATFSQLAFYTHQPIPPSDTGEIDFNVAAGSDPIPTSTVITVTGEQSSYQVHYSDTHVLKNVPYGNYTLSASAVVNGQTVPITLSPAQLTVDQTHATPQAALSYVDQQADVTLTLNTAQPSGVSQKTVTATISDNQSAHPVSVSWNNIAVVHGLTAGQHYHFSADPITGLSAKYTFTFTPTDLVVQKGNNPVTMVADNTPIPTGKVDLTLAGLPENTTTNIYFTNIQNQTFTFPNLKNGEQVLSLPSGQLYTLSADTLTQDQYQYQAKSQQINVPSGTVPAVLTYTKTLANTHQLVGYLDVTQQGYAEQALGMSSPSAYPTNLKNLSAMGYKVMVLGWLSVGTGTSQDPVQVQIFGGPSADTATIIKTITPIAEQEGMKVLVSTGGSAATFRPGAHFNPIGSDLTADQIQQLAKNIVATLQSYQIQGIDFDLEQEVDPTFLATLIADLKADWPEIIITAAPQLNDVGGDNPIQLVTTGNFTDYNKALQENGFDALFIQDYCTAGYQLNKDGALTTTGGYTEQDPEFVAPSYYAVKRLLPADSKTQIFLGEPVSEAASGGCANIFNGPQASDPETLFKILGQQYRSLQNEPNFGGAMAWSINWDGQNTPPYAFVKHIAPALAI